MQNMNMMERYLGILAANQNMGLKDQEMGLRQQSVDQQGQQMTLGALLKARELQEKGALLKSNQERMAQQSMAQGQFRNQQIDVMREREAVKAAMQERLLKMREDAAKNRPSPPAPVINSSTGMFERTPQGLRPLLDPSTGQPLRPQGALGANFERNISKDFESHPAVKIFNELQPDVEVVNSYMRTRPAAKPAEKAVYDKNLVNTFLRVTHPKGDQISNFERKDLAGLPALDQRLTQSIVGFFEGRYIPDDVAAQMSNIINQKFGQRRSQVADIENKFVEDVRRQGGNPATIREITRGERRRADDEPPPGAVRRKN